MRSEILHTTHIDFPKHNARTLFKNSVPVSYFFVLRAYILENLSLLIISLSARTKENKICETMNLIF